MLCNFIAQGDARARGVSPVPSCTIPSPHRVHASPESDARMSALRPYTYHWSLPMSSASMGYGRVGATMAPGDPNPPLTSRPPHPVHQPRPTNWPVAHLSSPCARPADTPCSRGRTPAGVNRWCEMPYGGRARPSQPRSTRILARLPLATRACVTSGTSNTWGLHMGWVDRWGTGFAPPCEEPRSLLTPSARSTGGRQQHASLTSSPQPYRHSSRILHTAKLGEHAI